MEASQTARASPELPFQILELSPLEVRYEACSNATKHIFPTKDNIFHFVPPTDKNIRGCAGTANHVTAENPPQAPPGPNELSGSHPQADVHFLVNESWNQNKFYYRPVQSKYGEIPLR